MNQFIAIQVQLSFTCSECPGRRPPSPPPSSCSSPSSSAGRLNKPLHALRGHYHRGGGLAN